MASTSRSRNLFGAAFGSFRRDRRPAREKARSTPRRHILGVESLEERVVLSTFTVNTFNDTPAAFLSGPFAGDDANGNISLRSAIEAINADPGIDHTSDTIILPAGYYDLNSAYGELDVDPSDVPSGVTTNPITSVTIMATGGQAIINDPDLDEVDSRVFELHSGQSNTTVSFNLGNLTIQGGVSNGGGDLVDGSVAAVGGGILAEDSSLSLENVFMANSAVGSSSTPDAQGGDLFAYDSAVSIKGGTFTGYADAYTGGQALGGSIAIQGGSLSLTGVTIFASAARYGVVQEGGGIYASGASVSITGSTLSDSGAQVSSTTTSNTPGGGAFGGAVFIAGSTLSASNTLFSSDSAVGGSSQNGAGGPAQGGAVFIGKGSAIFANDTFQANSASGGAGSNANNGASIGGAILNLGTVTITDCTFSQNSASGPVGGTNVTGEGGAIANIDGSVTLTGSTVSDDTAQEGASIENIGDGVSENEPLAYTVGPATLTSSGSTLAEPDGSTGFQQQIVNAGTASNQGVYYAIGGVPTTSTPAGTPLSLTANSTDPSPSGAAPNYNFLWQAVASTGQTVLAGQALTLSGSNPTILPAGLINGATTLTLNVSFETTPGGGGVILGYQNQPVGTTPTHWVPALYVGTNGLLYAEIWNGAVQPIASATKVNNGQEHTAVFTLSGSTETLTLDGKLVGTLTGSPQPLDMTFDELGDGETGGWPEGTGGFDPFVGTLSNVVISTSSTVAGAFTFPVVTGAQSGGSSGGTSGTGGAAAAAASSGARVTFAPPGAGTETLSLLATNSLGGTAVTTSTLNVTDVPPTPIVSGLPAGGSPQGTAVSLTASATDPSTIDTAAGFSFLWQAANSQGQSGSGSQALSFNGTSQFVNIGNYPDLDFSGQITLEAWIKPGSTTGLEDIIAHGYQFTPSYAEDFLRIDSGYYQVGSWNGNTGLAQAAIPASDVGQWVFLAGVYDGTQWDLYRDGVLVGTSGPTSQGALPVSATNWAIGASGAGTDRFFLGQIDDVSIWNVGRSATQVRSDMSAPLSTTQSGLVADYLFNETSGTTVLDATANYNNGVLGNSTPADEPTRVAGIVTGSTLSFKPPVPGTYTISLWATDVDGETGLKTASLNVTETPTVSAGANVTVQQATPFTRSGSFTDVASDGPWTATVNYGDGTGTQTLPLGGQTFPLDHSFASAGSFTVTVSVTNQYKLTGTASFTVTVSGFTVNDGSRQDSMVRSLTYVFPYPTEVEPGAFVLLRDGKPTKINLVITPQPDKMVYLITFSGKDVIGGSVPDGNYTLITHYKKVHVLSGPPMTSNDVNTFVRLFGDVEGLGVVTAADKGLLKQAEADPNSKDAAYFEYDGKSGIDKTDIAEFDKRYKGNIDPPRRPPAKFRGRTFHHQSADRPTSSPQRPAGRVAVITRNPLIMAAIGALAPRKEHHR